MGVGWEPSAAGAGPEEEFPAAFADGEATFGGVGDEAWCVEGTLTETGERGGNSRSRPGGGPGDFGTKDFGAGGEEVELFHEGVARAAGFDDGGPVRDEALGGRLQRDRICSRDSRRSGRD